MNNSKKLIFIAGFFLFFVALNAHAANVGDVVNFTVDKGFDASGRTQAMATLVSASNKLYFYVDNTWWSAQTQAQQAKVLTDLGNLSGEFDNNIYPKLTSTFGTEWNPGIDNDSKITVLFEPMNSIDGGYFRESDEYDKLQLPDSNQREMLYLTASSIDDPNAKAILAHEFMHLIIFNQKNKINGVEEDTWVNEGISDYTSTLLGYDDVYAGSNLQARVNDFIENPSDSLTDFQNSKYDFASVNLFMHYLVDHYGTGVLSNALKTKLIGIDAINYGLQEVGAKENFAQVFTNWTISLALNDCSKNSEYCYLNKNLTDLRISPTLIFLPLSGNTSLSSTDVTKNWAGNWQKIIGGSGNLKLDFSSLTGLNFQVPYILYDTSNNYTANFLQLDGNQKGEINIKDFGTKYKSLIIIPSLQTVAAGVDGSGLLYPYTFVVSITGNNPDADQTLIQSLLDQIASLKQQIAKIQAQNNLCSVLNNNLSFGSSGSEVSCLQAFLKKQGTNIYPSGLVTGNFGNLTRQAVINFQKANGILQTGFVGPVTRNKINSILNAQ